MVGRERERDRDRERQRQRDRNRERQRERKRERESFEFCFSVIGMETEVEADVCADLIEPGQLISIPFTISCLVGFIAPFGIQKGKNEMKNMY